MNDPAQEEARRLFMKGPDTPFRAAIHYYAMQQITERAASDVGGHVVASVHIAYLLEKKEVYFDGVVMRALRCMPQHRLDALCALDAAVTDTEQFLAGAMMILSSDPWTRRS